MPVVADLDRSIEPADDIETGGSPVVGVRGHGQPLMRRHAIGEADVAHHQIDIRRQKCEEIFRSGAFDAVIHLNFRADRARQLTRAFALADFDAFDRGATPRVSVTTLTEYQDPEELPVRVAYPPLVIDSLAAHLARLRKRQLHVAETEKYAHVTYFFNGGVEEPFRGEERILVPSPRVATYDRQPEMMAPEVTRRLVGALEAAPPPHLVVLNYANPDMVGHTGDLEATIEAVEAVDAAVPAQPLMLKWPNDLMLQGRKLGGILLERSGDRIAVGFGVNLASAPALPDRQAADLGGQIGAEAFVPLLAGSFSRLLALWRSSEPALNASGVIEQEMPTERPMRFFSRSTLMTLTLTSCPTSITSNVRSFDMTLIFIPGRRAPSTTLVSTMTP